MEIVSIQGHRKEASGKEHARRIRREGMVPCVMYKSGGGDAISFSLNPAEARPLVYTPKFKMAEITLDGKTHKCILKELQFHPVTEAVMHIDFLELVPGIKFKASVPVRYEGTAPGVKAGGKFLPKLRNVKIMTTPEKAVDEVVANIGEMELGSTIRVRDIKLTEGVDILNPPAVPIASIEIPRALRGK
ncbi:MAG: 50S ribosomal protein L25 [Saprospiraceae bacterium]